MKNDDIIIKSIFFYFWALKGYHEIEMKLSRIEDPTNIINAKVCGYVCLLFF